MADDTPPLDARSILSALVEGGVEFVVIGGLAVGAHGHQRGTKDVDIVPSPERENLARLAAVLERLDYRISGTEEFEPDELVRPDLEGLLDGGSWVLNTKYGGLDIMQLVPPDLEYEDLREGAISAEVFGITVWFCGYRQLVAMKEAAGRARDFDDLERLRQARGELE